MWLEAKIEVSVLDLRLVMFNVVLNIWPRHRLFPLMKIKIQMRGDIK